MSEKSLSSAKLEGQTNPFVRCFQLVQRTGAMDNPLCQGAFRTFYFAYKRYVEDPYYALARRYPAIFQDGHVIDVGANIGYTACTFAGAVSPGFKVYAFEPEYHCFNQLLASIKHKQLTEIVSPIRSAVGEFEGTINIWRNRDHNGDHRTVTDELMKSSAIDTDEIQSVPIASIDGFMESCDAPGPISFIKMDVQGYELPVCRGMRKTLVNNPRAVVAFEYSPKETRQLGFSESELLEFFRSRDFYLNIIDHSGRLFPMTEAHLDTFLGKRGYADILAARQELSLD